MTVTSLRIEDSLYKEVQELAKFYGTSVTAFMRSTILERVEDEKDYAEAMQIIKESDGETVSRKEVMKMVGLSDE